MRNSEYEPMTKAEIFNANPHTWLQKEYIFDAFYDSICDAHDNDFEVIDTIMCNIECADVEEFETDWLANQPDIDFEAQSGL